MPVNRRVIEDALKAKGFVRTQGDHTFFIYYSQDGKKSPVRTKLSYGTSHKDITDNLLSQMAKQCKLTNKDFRNLIDCPLSRSAYEAMLIGLGFVDRPQV